MRARPGFEDFVARQRRVVLPGLAILPADQQPLQLNRQGWLIVAVLLSLTGMVLAMLHLREGRIPEVASTLFLTVVSSGLMMWAALRKPI